MKRACYWYRTNGIYMHIFIVHSYFGKVSTMRSVADAAKTTANSAADTGGEPMKEEYTMENEIESHVFNMLARCQFFSASITDNITQSKCNSITIYIHPFFWRYIRSEWMLEHHPARDKHEKGPTDQRRARLRDCNSSEPTHQTLRCHLAADDSRCVEKSREKPHRIATMDSVLFYCLLRRCSNIWLLVTSNTNLDIPMRCSRAFGTIATECSRAATVCAWVRRALCLVLSRARARSTDHRHTKTANANVYLCVCAVHACGAYDMIGMGGRV